MPLLCHLQFDILTADTAQDRWSWADQRGFLFGKGSDIMAVKKAAGGIKKQEGPASKAKTGAVKSAAKKETAPKKSSAAATKPAATKPAVTKPAVTKPAATKAAPKAAAAKPAVKKAAPKPVKLSVSQTELLKKISGTSEPGYLAEKKAEQKTIDALLERKLVKKGSKHKEKGTYHHLISTAGKKHLETAAAEAAKSSSPSGS